MRHRSPAALISAQFSYEDPLFSAKHSQSSLSRCCRDEWCRHSWTTLSPYPKVCRDVQEMPCHLSFAEQQSRHAHRTDAIRMECNVRIELISVIDGSRNSSVHDRLVDDSWKGSKKALKLFGGCHPSSCICLHSMTSVQSLPTD